MGDVKMVPAKKRGRQDVACDLCEDGAALFYVEDWESDEHARQSLCEPCFRRIEPTLKSEDE